MAGSRPPANLVGVRLRKALLEMLASLASGLSAQPKRAQQPRECLSCVIRATPFLVVDGAGSGSRTYEFSELYRLPSGRFVIGPLVDGWHAVLDPDGRFIHRFGGDVGRPKDLPVVARIEGDLQDTVHLYDNFWQRELVFGPAGQFVRARRLPLPPFWVIRLPEERLLVQGRLRTQAAAGYPFHVVEASGRVSRSFGVDRPQLLPDRPLDDARAIAPARDSNAFWSAWHNRHAIEKWSFDGRRLLSVELKVPWFEPWTRPPDGPVRAVKPPPFINALWEDDSGLVWLLTRVPKVDWKPTAKRRQGDEEDLTTIDDALAVFDTIIEVIDPQSSRMVASARLSGPFGYFLRGGIVVGMRSRDSHAVLQLARVRLER